MNMDLAYIFLPSIVFALFGGGLLALIAKLKGRSWLAWGAIGTVCGLIPIIGFIGWIIAVIIVLAGSSKHVLPAEVVNAFTQGAKYSHMEGHTGIALVPDERVIRLKNGPFIKQYTFADVRAWRVNSQSGGGIINTSTNLASSVAAASANSRIRRENQQASGLFVQMRDIDMPEWRIDMPSQQQQARWMEIMRQLINDD